MAASRSRLALVRAAVAVGCIAVPVARGHAADLGLSRRVVLLIYDVGLYEGALDRAMAQADRGGVYAGESSAARARNRVATRKAMLGQRDAVLNAAAAAVAARATDPELNELLRAATARDAVAETPLMDEAVAVVKSSVAAALWDQLGRTARGTAEFPCTRDQRSRCS